VKLVLPAGWSCVPAVSRFTVAPDGSAKTSVSIHIPNSFHDTHGRLAIAADVLADGKYLGQIAEAVIDVRAEPPPATRTAAGF
jgi:hypothetical protein